MLFSHHFITRLKERFPKLIEDIGVQETLTNIERAFHTDVHPFWVTAKSKCAMINIRVYSSDKKYTTHKLCLIMAKNNGNIITVLTDKMRRQRYGI